MPDVFHVGTDLVGATRFENTFHECDVGEAFQHIIMGHSVLANFRIRGKHSHLHTVFWIAGDIAFDAPFVFCEVAPHDGIVFTLRRLVEELQTEFRFGISGLGDDEQARCDFVFIVRTVEHHLDDVAWLHLVAALHGFVICHDKPCIGSFLNAVA